MVYVFKKLNALTTPSNQGGKVLAGSGVGTDAATHESTFRNPQAVVEANKEEKLGSVNTGLTKSIQEQQQGMEQESQKYQQNLADVGKKYDYQGRSDLEGINDTARFARLSGLMNPNAVKSEMSGVTTNTQYYRPDTQGVQALSTKEGLASSLRNQYGTSAGGSRLDATIARRSGQAGEQIRQNQQQIQQFNQDQLNRLNQEKNMLAQQQSGVEARSKQMQQEAGAYQNELSQAAEAQRQAIQQQYDAKRQAEIARLQGIGSGFVDQNALTSTLSDELDKYLQSQGVYDSSNRYNAKLTEALANAGLIQALTPEEMAAAGLDRNQLSVASSGMGGLQYNTPEQYQALNVSNPYFAMVDPSSKIQLAEARGTREVNPLTYYRNLMPQKVQELSQGFMKNFNPLAATSPDYTEQQTQFTANEFLDPRFNRLAELLGTQGRTADAVQDTDVTTNEALYRQMAQQDYNNRVNQLKSEIAKLGISGLQSDLGSDNSVLGTVLGLGAGGTNQLANVTTLGAYNKTGLQDALNLTGLGRLTGNTISSTLSPSNLSNIFGW